MDDGTIVVKRKVLNNKKYKNSRATPKVSIPRWWVRGAEEVVLYITHDEIRIKRVERG